MWVFWKFLVFLWRLYIKEMKVFFVMGKCFYVCLKKVWKVLNIDRKVRMIESN